MAFQTGRNIANSTLHLPGGRERNLRSGAISERNSAERIRVFTLSRSENEERLIAGYREQCPLITRIAINLINDKIEIKLTPHVIDKVRSPHSVMIFEGHQIRIEFRRPTYVQIGRYVASPPPILLIYKQRHRSSFGD